MKYEIFGFQFSADMEKSNGFRPSVVMEKIDRTISIFENDGEIDVERVQYLPKSHLKKLTGYKLERSAICYR